MADQILQKAPEIVRRAKRIDGGVNDAVKGDKDGANHDGSVEA